MAFLYKRPLAAGCILLILTAALALSLSFLVLTVCFAVAAALLFAALIFYFCKRRRSYTAFCAVLLAVCALLGFGRVFAEQAYTQRYVSPVLGTEIDAVLMIDDVRYVSSYSSGFLATVECLNGTDCNLDVYLNVEATAPFGIGDRIAGRFLCSNDFSEERERTAPLADGTCAVLTPVAYHDILLIESGNGTLRSFVSDLRNALHFGLADAVGGEEGALVGALILGTRSFLQADTVKSFRRVGASHILAISGLHLMILSGILEWILIRLRMGKHARSCIQLLFFAAYLVLTGFLFSMMRAVLMMLILHLAFFFGGDYDGPTALGIGGAVIVLAAPGAVYSLSFQMTMLATLGLLAFGEIGHRMSRFLPRRKGVRRLPLGLIRGALTSLAVTLFAMIAILPVQWMAFGEISLITPLANLLLIPLITPLLLLGAVLLILTAVGLPSGPLYIPVRLLSKAVLGIARALSDIDGMLSLEFDFVAWILIPMLVLTVVLLLLRLKRAWQPLVLLPLALSIVAFPVCLGIHRAMGDGAVKLIYRADGGSEGLMLTQNGEALICDITNGSMTQAVANEAALEGQGVCDINVLMLTHYHSRQPATLNKLFSSYMVRTLWLPPPLDDEDTDILIDILAIAVQQEVAVTVYKYGSPLTVFDTGTVTVHTPLTQSRSVEPALRIDVSYGSRTVRYESAAYGEYAKALLLDGSDATVNELILGSHGPRPHSPVEITDTTVTDRIWVASEEILKYHAPLPQAAYVMLPALRVTVLE